MKAKEARAFLREHRDIGAVEVHIYGAGVDQPYSLTMKQFENFMYPSSWEKELEDTLVRNGARATFRIPERVYRNESLPGSCQLCHEKFGTFVYEITNEFGWVTYVCSKCAEGHKVTDKWSTRTGAMIWSDSPYARTAQAWEEDPTGV